MAGTKARAPYFYSAVTGGAELHHQVAHLHQHLSRLLDKLFLTTSEVTIFQNGPELS